MAEIIRRVLHTSGSLVPGIYIAGLVEWQVVRFIVLGGMCLAIGLEIVRLVVGLDWWIYRQLTREYEQHKPAGYALAVVSGGIVVLLFEPLVAVPALLMLTIADPISGVLGTGELRTVKQLHVLVVTFLVASAVALASFTLLEGVGTARTLVLPALLGGIAVMLADGVKPMPAGIVIDDNFSIPLGAGVTIWAAITYLPTVTV